MPARQSRRPDDVRQRSGARNIAAAGRDLRRRKAMLRVRPFLPVLLLLVAVPLGARAEPASPAPPSTPVPMAAPRVGFADTAANAGPEVAPDPVSTRIKGYMDDWPSVPALAQPMDGTVRRFYLRRQYRPAWRDPDNGWSPQADLVLAAMRDADRDGLNPAAFRTAQIRKALDAVPAGTPATPEVTAELAAADIALSAAVLHYIRDMTGGGLDGHRFHWQIPWEYADPAQILINGLAAPDMKAWLGQIGPHNHAYAGLKAMLAEYRAMAKRPWRPMARGPKLSPGDRDPRVPQLRAILRTLGDLPARGAQSARRAAPHPVRLASVGGDDLSLTDDPPTADAQVYDDALMRAVRRFQKRHGLAPDGIVGQSTQAALDISPRQRMEQIRANMQRLRWMPRELPPRFISVNLPGYQLQAIDGDQVRLTMRVVAGQPDWPTPIIADWIVNLKFAPTWTIPPKIARTETLAKIQADPSYLNRLGFEVLNRGTRVDPASIHWWRLTPKSFPYTLRQKPGKENALGLIRFSLTNPFGIYLHDTSNPAAFRKWGRNLSHGCVRVEQPAELAAFVMNSPDWPASRIQGLMDAAKPFIKAVPDPVPVFLVYFTAWRGAQGEAQFRNDMYGLDPALSAAL
jgi:murein L,D-transpeptidase YcbB/YkuD